MTKKIYEKKKRNLRGSLTYGSGSHKKNRGSGNTGGVGKGGIWDHKKGSAKYYQKIRATSRIQRRKKKQKLTELVTRFISSKKYVKKMVEKGCIIDNLKKLILVEKFCKLIIPTAFLNKIGYTIENKRE